MKAEVTRHWHDGSESIGYSEGELDRRAFTPSWAAWSSAGATFYDTWLDATARQRKAIAAALRRAKPGPRPE